MRANFDEFLGGMKYLSCKRRLVEWSPIKPFVHKKETKFEAYKTEQF